jgi:hypothetical protein
MMVVSSTIVIKNTTRERLKEIGRKSQTYDEIINKLLRKSVSEKDSPDSRLVDLQSSESGGQ